jgi:hypothetical protein
MDLEELKKRKEAAKTTPPTTPTTTVKPSTAPQGATPTPVPVPVQGRTPVPPPVPTVAKKKASVIEAPNGLFIEPVEPKGEEELYVPPLLQTPPLLNPQETGLADYAKRERPKDELEIVDGHPDLGSASAEGNRPSAEEALIAAKYDADNVREARRILQDEGVHALVKAEAETQEHSNANSQRYINARVRTLQEMDPSRTEEDARQTAIDELAILKTQGLWASPILLSWTKGYESEAGKTLASEMPQSYIVGRSKKAGYITEQEGIGSWVGHGFSVTPELAAAYIAPKEGQSFSESVAERRTLTTALPEKYPDHPYVAMAAGLVGDILLPGPGELAVGATKIGARATRAGSELLGLKEAVNAMDRLGVLGPEVATIAQAERVLSQAEKALAQGGDEGLRAAEQVATPATNNYIRAKVLSEVSDVEQNPLLQEGAKDAWKAGQEAERLAFYKVQEEAREAWKQATQAERALIVKAAREEAEAAKQAVKEAKAEIDAATKARALAVAEELKIQRALEAEVRAQEKAAREAVMAEAKAKRELAEIEATVKRAEAAQEKAIRADRVRDAAWDATDGTLGEDLAWVATMSPAEKAALKTQAMAAEEAAYKAKVLADKALAEQAQLAEREAQAAIQAKQAQKAETEAARKLQAARRAEEISAQKHTLNEARLAAKDAKANLELSKKLSLEAIYERATVKRTTLASQPVPVTIPFAKQKFTPGLSLTERTIVGDTLERMGQVGLAPRTLSEIVVALRKGGHPELADRIIDIAKTEYKGLRKALSSPATAKTILGATEGPGLTQSILKAPFFGLDELAPYRAAGLSDDLARKVIEGQRVVAATVNEAVNGVVAEESFLNAAIEAAKKTGVDAVLRFDIGDLIQSVKVKDLAGDMAKLQPELKPFLDALDQNAVALQAFDAGEQALYNGLPLSERVKRYLTASYAGVFATSAMAGALPTLTAAEKAFAEAATEFQTTVKILEELPTPGSLTPDRAQEILSFFGVTSNREAVAFKEIITQMGEQVYVPQFALSKLAAEIAPILKVRTPLEMAKATLHGLWRKSVTRGSMLSYRPSYLLYNAFDDAIQTYNIHGFLKAATSTARSAFFDMVGLATLSAPKVAEVVTGSQAVGIAASMATGPALALVSRGLKALPKGLRELPRGLSKLPGFDAVMSRLGMAGDVGPLLNAEKATVKLGGKSYTYAELYAVCVRGGVLETQASELNVAGASAWLNALDGGQELVEALALRKRGGLFLTLVDGGMTPEQAAKGVIDALYDYKYSMSQGEADFVRIISPFWTWQKNAQRQVYGAFSSPKGLYRMGTVIRGREAIAKAADIMAMEGDYDQDSVAVGRMPSDLAEDYTIFAEDLRQRMPNAQDRADFWRNYRAKSANDPVALMATYWDNPAWQQAIPAYSRDASARMGWISTGVKTVNGLDQHDQEKAWFAALPPSGVVANFTWAASLGFLAEAMIDPSVDAYSVMERYVTDPSRGSTPVQVFTEERENAPLDAGLARIILAFPGMESQNLIDYRGGRYFLRGKYAIGIATQTGLLAASTQLSKGEMPYVPGSGYNNQNLYLLLKSVGFPVGVVPLEGEQPAIKDVEGKMNVQGGFTE